MYTQLYHTVYFSHGGGPLPLMGDPSHQAMIEFMTNLTEKLIKPDYILVISAHWEESQPTLLGSSHPPMFYDYYGFPPEAYQIDYPAPGCPDLADKIVRTLVEHNIPSRIDTQRGFDHGLFIPLSLKFPKADIPSTQLSLVRGLDPSTHIALGKALRDSHEDKLLVIGSGFSFHNMQAFDWSGVERPDPLNDAFQDWLINTCVHQSNSKLTLESLLHWEKAPNARYCHPREEHLLPLLVCSAYAQNSANVVFDDYILGKRSIALAW